MEIIDASADQRPPQDQHESTSPQSLSEPKDLPEPECLPEPESLPELESLDEPLDPQQPITTLEVVEAILFAGDEPITAKKLAELVEAGTARQMEELIDQLNDKYRQMNCAFRIERIAGGYQMLTLGKFNVWLRRLNRARQETKLSPAALETLAIVAYKQPVMRVEVEVIRGVGCGEMIRQLCEKGLVKIVGRAEELGRPLLYGTTRRFLEVFGMNSLNDLPQAESLRPEASKHPVLHLEPRPDGL